MRLSANLTLFVAFFGLVSCGFPGNQLTKEERAADINWAFQIFDSNYAPAELKKETLGVDLKELRGDCLKASEEEMTNGEFFALFQKCIHRVQDAHVTGSQPSQEMLPEFAQIAHLGVLTARSKFKIDGEKIEALRVLGQFPSSVSVSYPLQAGDLITSIDGIPVVEYHNKELIPYFNVGQTQSNLNIAGLRFAARVSVEMALPKTEDITMTVHRGVGSFDVTLPWIVEDLLQFQANQAAAQAAQAAQVAQPEEPGRDDDSKPKTGVVIQNPLARMFFGYDVMAALFSKVGSPAMDVSRRVMAILENGFRFTQFNPILNLFMNGELLNKDEDPTVEPTAIVRAMPMAKTSVPLLEDQAIPAAVVTTEAGEVYAYIQIAGFPGEDTFVDEFNRLIAQINKLEIKGLIIDMIDNGGGSLIHGMRMANTLRKSSIEFPSMQLRLNNNWMNSFRSQAAFGATDAEKTMAKRLLEKLEEDKAAGLRLSRPISITSLDPFGLLASQKLGCEATGKCLAEGVKIALTVNEFCVSMCDIFADSFQDNELGLVIGSKTMGGGGNVSPHALSPVSKLMLNLTESLIVSAKGEKYLENNGVEPDVAVDMTLDREAGFQGALTQAYLYVTGQMEPAPVPVPVVAAD